jgi:hypothetical protein
MVEQMESNTAGGTPMPLNDVVNVTEWEVASVPFHKRLPAIVIFFIVEFHVYSASGLVIQVRLP